MSVSEQALPISVKRTGVRRLSLKNLGLILAAGLLLVGVWFQRSYPGFTRGIINQARYATVTENRNLWFCISYWVDFMQKLRLNEQTGIYSFAGLDETRLSDFERGQLAYHRGEFAPAVILIERDIKQRGESETKLFWLAMSYMRQAEAENCLPQFISPASAQHAHDHGQHQQAQWCALPLTRFHDRAASARAAAKTFEQLLDRYDRGNRLYQWLLNFNYMTVNGFPGEVPPAYRINSRFTETFYGARGQEMAAAHPELSFTDRARELGVNTYTTGRGVAVEDFDHDGFLDIVSGGSFGVVTYYHNEQGHGFVERTQEAGLGQIKQPFVITCADYDNDGWMDIFFGRPFGSYALYRNNHDGTFSDVTAAAGLLDCKTDEQIAATWISAWADVDNDGDLDLFLAQWGFKMPFVSGLMRKPRLDSKLFINEGGHFTDRTLEYGLGPVVADQYFIGAAFGDYDGDGYPDLFLSSPLRNTSVLLRNVAGTRFAQTDLIHRAEGGFSAAFVDFDHDGRLDIFQAGFADAKTSTAMAVFGEGLDRYSSGHSTILWQTATGRFVERNDLFDLPMSTMGSSFGDLNNDGCYDFYLGKGDPEGWFVLPNLMYLGVPQGTKCAAQLSNISMLHGFGTIQKGHGIVFADFDGDGKQDVYSSLGGMWPADAWPSQLFVNQSKLTNSWVKLRLRGRKTNYYGLGATLKVSAENAQGEEIVRTYLMDQKTGFGSGPYLAHIGLLDAVRIKGVEVYWPASRCRRLYQAELGKLNILDEGACFTGASKGD